MIESQPKPEWADLPRPGCKNVRFRVLLANEDLAVANLRFSNKATIDRHDAPFEIDVLCLEGSGYASIEDEVFPIKAGQTIRWPKSKEHCLWTDGEEMETIMVERHGT